MVLQLVGLYHLLGVKLDVPEQHLEAVVVFEVRFCLEDDPDVLI